MSFAEYTEKQDKYLILRSLGLHAWVIFPHELMIIFQDKEVINASLLTVQGKANADKMILRLTVYVLRDNIKHVSFTMWLFSLYGSLQLCPWSWIKCIKDP